MFNKYLLVVLPVACLFSADVFASSDFEHWSEGSLEGNLAEKLSVKMTEKIRFNDNAVKHYYSSTDIEFVYKTLGWLDTGLCFRTIYQLKFDRWRNEERLHLQGTAKWKQAFLGIKNRAMVEYRIREGKEDTWRFRDKLTLQAAKGRFTPYVEHEIFIDENDSFNEDRTYLGSGLKLNGKIGLDIYYLLKLNKVEDEWDRTTNVIGSKLKFNF